MTKSIISELCDCVMQSYEESDARDMEQELIAKDISSLANQLVPEHKAQLVSLLDRINNADSQAYYKAFENGMQVAMVLFSKTD